MEEDGPSGREGAGTTHVVVVVSIVVVVVVVIVVKSNCVAI